MIEALGRERVLMGMGNAGGERQGHVVRCLWSRRLPLLFGELDDVTRPRTEAIALLFRSAGLSARVVKNVDAYLKTHAAGLPACAGAVYMAGGEIRRLARMPEALKLFVQAYSEALQALRTIGIPLRPAATRLLELIPEPILVFGLRLLFASRVEIVGGMERVFNSSADEMKELADQLRAILLQSGLPSPASDILFAQVDARFQAGREGFSAASAAATAMQQS
jgi:2-dehydropantoate 2-reductase